MNPVTTATVSAILLEKARVRFSWRLSKDSPKPIATLAEATGTDASALARIMRCQLASILACMTKPCWPPTEPRPRLFELARKTKQCRLIPILSNELDADWQSCRIPIQWHRHGRIPRDVAYLRKSCGPPAFCRTLSI